MRNWALLVRRGVSSFRLSPRQKHFDYGDKAKIEYRSGNNLNIRYLIILNMADTESDRLPPNIVKHVPAQIFPRVIL